MVKSKYCPKCREIKPVAEFGVRRRNKDGLYEYCKSCACKREKERREKDIDAAREKVRARRAASPSIKGAEKAYREANREKVREWARNFHERHREDRLEKQREYARRNSAAAVAKATKWKKANSGRVNADTARRYARKTGGTPAWVDMSAVKEIYTYAKEFRDAGIRVDVDHIVPIRHPLVCGLHAPANLRVILTKYNQAKGNRYWPDMP